MGVTVKEYGWKNGARLPLSPNVAGQHIEQLQSERGGFITPEELVEDAAAPESPLHPAFEWNDAAAATAHRISQARYILRSLTVTVRVDDRTELPHMRAVVMVKSNTPNDAPAYISTVAALSNDDWRGEVLARARKELSDWRKRYQDLQEFAALMPVLDRYINPQGQEAA
jgi:hypothetical protein